VWLLEIIFPWRKNKRFYAKILARFILSFFNFFLLNLILLIALSNVMEQFINDTLHIFGFELMSIQLFQYQNYHKPLALFFFASDFIQWNVHRLLHTIPFLWKIHKTHHSVKEMGLRRILDTTGWNLLFTNQYCIFLLSLLDVNLQDVFIVHFISIAIGHLNHANLGWDYGF
jgi:sterol desaturase/sphingolipid hydroxylase (fatty acid hydroxylase superfamily)